MKAIVVQAQGSARFAGRWAPKTLVSRYSRFAALISAGPSMEDCSASEVEGPKF